MNSVNLDTTLARAYVDAVKEFFAPSGETAEKTEQLDAAATNLTEATKTGLSSPNPAIRTQASERLLAKMIIDLEIGSSLLQSAQDAEAGIAGTAAGSGDRGRGGTSTTDLEPYFQILLGQAGTAVRVDRGVGALPGDLETARLKLPEAAQASLFLISKQAAETSQSAITKLLGLGVAEVGQFVGSIGMDLANVMGQGETVARLYQALSGRLSDVYNSLIELLGRGTAEEAVKKMQEWLNESGENIQLDTILKKFYQAEQTHDKITQLAKDSPAALSGFNTAIEEVQGLRAAYGSHADLVKKILDRLGWLSLIPDAVFPPKIGVLALLYLGLGSYIVYLGGDYVDAPSLDHLQDRVPGVRRVVETNLGRV